MLLEDLSPTPIYYFAYGMLSDPANMPDAELIGAATLSHFKLEMLKYANVINDPSSTVFGALWKLNRNILSDLDAIEGKPWLYNRKTVPVYYNGQKYIAELYTMTPETRTILQGTLPDRAYIASLINGYRNAHLPLDQLRKAIDNISTELTEVNMSPSALKDFADSPTAQEMTIGFEAEMVVPNLENVAYPKLKPDYSKDTPFPVKNYDTKVAKFLFNGGIGSDNGDWIQSRLGKLEEQFEDYVTDEFFEYISSEKGIKLLHDTVGKLLGTADRDKIDFEIKNETSRYQDAFDEIHDNFEDQPGHFKRFLTSIKIATIKDFARKYSIKWPYNTKDTTGLLTVEELTQNFRGATGFNAVASLEYHTTERKPGLWIFEPDASIDSTKTSNGIELISPPMKLPQALTAFDTFWNWASSNKIIANKSCGFHVGVSLPSQTTKNIDAVKLILFLGDDYVLNAFSRASNAYAESTFNKMKKLANTNEFDISFYIQNLNTGINSIAHKTINKAILPKSDHYLSINIRDTYVEFRAAGGNYFESKDKILNTIFRYIRAMNIAANPEAEKKEYAKKLYKLLDSSTSNTDVISYFAKFASGLITKNELKTSIMNLRK